MLEQVKLLHEAQLYDDVKSLTSLLMTMSDNNPDLLTMAAKYQALVYQADAFFFTQEYKKAESLYNKALHTKKLLNRSKGKTSTLLRNKPGDNKQAAAVDVVSEVEVKYRLHQCLCHLKQPMDAIVVLEGISLKQRTAKINMALAKLHHDNGMDRSAITGYKEVLRECPLSLEAAHGLISLGVNSREVVSLMMSGLTNLNNIDWVSMWIKGKACAHSKEYTNAIQTYRILDNKALLRDNIDLMCSLGEAQFLAGDYAGAFQTLHRAHLADPYLLKHMDILAFLYRRDRKVKELNQLSTKLIQITEQAPEAWVAMGYFCLATKNRMKAIYFAQKALSLGRASLEALLLKGTASLELKRHQDAILQFREALRIAPHRYEAHKGIVECYMASHRIREAISCAGQACKQLGTNARSFTMYASVLAKEPLTQEKAKMYLDKALKMDPTYVEAVYILVDILAKQQQYDYGIELLRGQLRQQSTAQLHTLLGDFLMHTNETQEALDQFSIALSLDAMNPRAQEGLERLEKHTLTDLGLDSTYDVEDMEGSENEAELDVSDQEGGEWY